MAVTYDTRLSHDINIILYIYNNYNMSVQNACMHVYSSISNPIYVVHSLYDL